MTDATQRVTQWIMGVKGEVPLVEELAIWSVRWRFVERTALLHFYAGIPL